MRSLLNCCILLFSSTLPSVAADGDIDTNLNFASSLTITDFAVNKGQGLAIRPTGTILQIGSWNYPTSGAALCLGGEGNDPSLKFTSIKKVAAGVTGTGIGTVQPDNKPVLLGAVPTGIAVVRLTPELKPDTAFDDTGTVILGASGDIPTSIALFNDGRIVIGARGITGKLCFTESNGGGAVVVEEPDSTAVTAIALQRNDAQQEKIVAVGYSGDGSSGFLARLGSNGTPDPTFGLTGATIPGRLRLDPPQTHPSARLYPQIVLVQTNRRIVVAGWVSWTDNQYHSRWFVARFYEDGSRMDPTMPYAEFKFGTAEDNGQVNAATIQEDGKLLLVGPTTMDQSGPIRVVRCTTRGALDASFGGVGSVTTSLVRDAHGIAVQPDGHIVVSGSAFISPKGSTSSAGFALVRFNNTNTSFLTVRATTSSPTPDILGYNLGHFYPGSNTHDWWRYSGTNAARIFLGPSKIDATMPPPSDMSLESEDDIPPWGDGVADESSFISRRSALREWQLDHSTYGIEYSPYIDWPIFESRYANQDLSNTSSVGNHIKANYALARLRELNNDIVAVISAKKRRFPIEHGADWAGKWELWQHYYSQAFYLAKNFSIHRFQMFNEPELFEKDKEGNVWTPTPDEWLTRLRICSDAMQSAVSDVNARYGKVLLPIIMAPVTTHADASYLPWGNAAVALQRRHENMLGQVDMSALLLHRYDYHQYDSSPEQFAKNLKDLSGLIAADLSGLAGLVSGDLSQNVTLSEFNVHSGGVFAGLDETLDSATIPDSDYEREKLRYEREKLQYPGRVVDPPRDWGGYPSFGSIVVNLVANGAKELFCFKFGQTLFQDEDRLFLQKNGTHYVDNDNEPFNCGGITKTGEVWRLFNKGFASGRYQKEFSRGSGLENLDIRVSYDPLGQRYYVFSANDSDKEVPLAVNCAAWDIPDGNRVLIEEVCERRYGTVAHYTEALSGIVPSHTQPARSIWLYTIPAKRQANVAADDPSLPVIASEDATVADGVANQNSNFGANSTLVVRNDPSDVTKRRAALVKFKLPLSHAPDIQLAVLSLHASATSKNGTVQAHVYGLDNDSWSQTSSPTREAVTWGISPSLKHGVVAGRKIANNFVSGGGDTAHILGQLVVASTTSAECQIDVTEFIRGQPDREATFLIVQEARWDAGAGDEQPDGLQIVSTEDRNVVDARPALKIVRLMDSDGDGISDEAETNVFRSAPTSADFDQDGLNDAEELLVYRSDPAKADTDRDGVSDRDEAIAGTDLTNPASFLQISHISKQGATIRLEWRSVAGKIYSIERTRSLSPPDWEPLGSRQGVAPTQTFIDEAPPTGAAWYRLRVE